MTIQKQKLCKNRTVDWWVETPSNLRKELTQFFKDRCNANGYLDNDSIMELVEHHDLTEVQAASLSTILNFNRLDDLEVIIKEYKLHQMTFIFLSRA